MFPGHPPLPAWPPVHCRLEFCDPPPHVTGQLDHEVHAVHVPQGSVLQFYVNNLKTAINIILTFYIGLPNKRVCHFLFKIIRHFCDRIIFYLLQCKV